ncbi:MAG: hypothetical protein LIO75_06945 [Lachnospiraceae bacterium]|nr:hypothetical protein [Lachnospiraceae bacterium]
MEKPKRLFFAVNEGRRVSCVNSLKQFVARKINRENSQQLIPLGTDKEKTRQSAVQGTDAEHQLFPVSGETASEDPLLGAGVLAAIIDSGTDYPYLYGEKVKACLRRGTRKLPGFSEYPNDRVGYGALCVRDSLP